MSNINFKKMKKEMDNLKEEERHQRRKKIEEGYLHFEEKKKEFVENGGVLFSSKCDGIQ